MANRSGLEVEGSPARAEAQRSEREKGGDHDRGIPKGAALGAPLVTFPASGKSPGCRAERLQVGAGAASPAKAPGHGAERPYMGAVGAQSPHFGEQEPSLPTCSRGGASPHA